MVKVEGMAAAEIAAHFRRKPSHRRVGDLPEMAGINLSRAAIGPWGYRIVLKAIKERHFISVRRLFRYGTSFGSGNAPTSVARFRCNLSAVSAPASFACQLEAGLAWLAQQQYAQLPWLALRIRLSPDYLGHAPTFHR